MQLIMTWPIADKPVQLTGSLTREQAIFFCAERGVFGVSSVGEVNNVAYFYQSPTGPVIFNANEIFTCLIDDEPIEFGQTKVLRYGATLQAGHFKFKTFAAEGHLAENGTDNSWLDLSSLNDNAEIIPQLEEILPDAGHYTGDLRYFNEITAASDAQGDILKKLEIEYKKFIVWGDQGHDYFSMKAASPVKISPQEDFFYENNRLMKSKTVTECIIQAPSLIEKVWQDLEGIPPLDNLEGEEEKQDILKSLAPENLISRVKTNVPELMFQEMYKSGLDSVY